MKAIAIHRFGGRDTLELTDLPIPDCGTGELRIRIKAAGVNPVDWKIREGLLKDRIPCQFPLVPGWDAAGVVDALGADVTRFKVGDEVFAYCRKPVIQHGTYAEFVVVPESFVALKPRTLTFTESAAIPLAGLTAYQSLFDAVKLTRGETVMVHAAAGGVGSYAVQLARDAGARVIGTAGAANYAFVMSLGAEEVIDYTQSDFRKTVRAAFPGGLDVVYDCVGGDLIEQSAEVLKPGGRLVSILDPARIQALVDRGIHAHYVFVTPNGTQLAKLAKLADEKKLLVHLAATFPLADAARAHELSESRHVRGKIVLTV
jgi:NADPH2:quinone reductase